MTGIIFLDFDGPIFPEKIHLYPQNQGEISAKKCKELNLHPYVQYWYADPFAIAILNILKEMYNYQLVISSSLADDYLHQKKHIQGLLNANGLNYNMHSDWRTPRNNEDRMYRKEQIEDWLKNHPEIHNNYLILDDIKSAPELFFAQTYLTSTLNQRNVYLSHEKDGLSYEQFDDMKFLMGLWNKENI